MSEFAADTLFLAGVLLGRGRPNTSHFSPASDDELEIVKKTQFVSLMLLHQAIMAQDFIAPRVANQRPCVITVVFGAMRDPTCFGPGAALNEELLIARSGGFELASVPALGQLIQRCSPRQFAALCHTLASTVMDPHIIGAESSAIVPSTRLLTERRERCREGTAATLNRNHAFLVAQPLFLPRIVKLVTLRAVPAKDSFLLDFVQVEGVAIMQGPGEAFLTAGMRNDEPMLNPEEEAALRERIMAAARRITSNPRMVVSHFDSWEALDIKLAAGPVIETEDRPIFMRDFVMAGYQVEVLFMLFSLLGGHRRADVHRKLGEIGAISALHQLCRQLDWAGLHGCQEFAPHGGDCDCNTENALKMHFLRVLHFMCDQMDDEDMARKRLLLSEDERKLLDEVDNGNRTRLELLGRPITKKRTRKTEVPFAWVDYRESVSMEVENGEEFKSASIHENLSGMLKYRSIANVGFEDGGDDAGGFVMDDNDNSNNKNDGDTLESPHIFSVS